LDAMRRKALDVAGEDKPGAGGIGTPDHTIQAVGFGDVLELQQLGHALEQTAHRERGGRAHARAVTRRARAFFVRLEWRNCASKRANALASAGPKNRPSASATNRRLRGTRSTISTRRSGPSSSKRTVA